MQFIFSSGRPTKSVRIKVNRGLSIVELMVGVAIGLFIMAGATMLLTAQLGDNRRLLLETQVQQDLRVAADMISRDIKRSGYWGDAYKVAWPSDVASALSNPYAEVHLDNNLLTGAKETTPTEFKYRRSTNEENHLVEDDNLTDAEQFGFRLNTDIGAIEYQLGKGNWQALTDPSVMNVSTLQLKVKSTSLPVPCGAACPVMNPGTAAQCSLAISVRDVEVTIVANAVHDPSVKRSLTDYVRLRNDAPECLP